MATKDEYVARMKAKLDQWNAEIDELDAKARKAKAQAAGEYAKQVTAIRKKVDVARTKLTEVQNAGGASWTAFRAGLEDIWEDVAQTLHDSRKAFRKNQSTD